MHNSRKGNLIEIIFEIADCEKVQASYEQSKWRSNARIDLVEQLFSAGKAYLKINSLVKTPLHEFMAVERSGLWAPDQRHFAGGDGLSSFRIKKVNTDFGEKEVQWNFTGPSIDWEYATKLEVKFRTRL